MEAARLSTLNEFNHHDELEQLLRSQYPNRNEKYYDILLKTRLYLVQTSFKPNLTTESIIKQCESARPTWYLYFKSTKHFYSEVLEVVPPLMIQYALKYLRENATYRNWTDVARGLKMLVFLSNTMSLVAFIPELRQLWFQYYTEISEGYADILAPILKLSPGRSSLFIRNIANEIILHKEKYFTNLDLFDRFVDREYALFLTEQNS